MKTALAVLHAFFLTLSAAAGAEAVESAAPGVPPVCECKSTQQRELGAWDDAFVCEDQDFIVLRRGQALFSLSMTGSADPKRLTEAPLLAKARIVAGAGCDDRLWLFMHGKDTVPFAIDARGGRLSRFDIPGLKIPGTHTPDIQSHVIVQHARGAILMIAGGDRDTWPRDGNRPVYFWMSLTSGKVRRFPMGWDLDYFSGDQRVAVFTKARQQRFYRRRLQAVDVATGGYVKDVPDRRKEPWVPFAWTETRSVKPLCLRRAATGDLQHLVGISLAGRMYHFDARQNGAHYLSTAKARRDFVAFRLLHRGHSSGQPSSLRLMKLKQNASPRLVARAVADFAMLDQGNCVFATFGHGPKGASLEAFFHSEKGRSTWNVLDGVKRLPELDEQLAHKAYVEDKMAVRLIDGFGKHDALVLCLFSHFRGDMRTGVPVGMGKGQDKAVETIMWRRAVILTSDGRRYMTNLFRKGNRPDRIWLHNSGKLILSSYDWRTSGMTKVRKIQLREITLNLKQKRE